MEKEKPVGLDLLREPFPEHQISKLPKPTKKQTDEVKANFKAGIRCKLCGAWHHPDVVHLDYVGHAALTDRLLQADLMWQWAPMGLTPEGLPLFDKTGGLWIELTVCGIIRIGYGHAAEKTFGDPGAREKEVIGDALRNAAMRFGAALDLWHKGDLHGDDDDDEGQNGDKGNIRLAEPKTQRPDAQKQTNLAVAGDAFVTDAQITRLFAITREKQWSQEQLRSYMLAAFQLESTKDLKRAEYDALIRTIQTNNYLMAIKLLNA